MARFRRRPRSVHTSSNPLPVNRTTALPSSYVSEMKTSSSTTTGLDALTLGEPAARSLGLDPRRLQRLLIAGTGLTVGAGVAVAGIVGFVGLIVPHLVRPLTDRSPSAILLPSALGGAALLTFADLAVRLIGTKTELKLGVVTAFLGVPFFLFHLMRERRVW